MFNKPAAEPTELDNAIARLFDFLKEQDPRSENYSAIADQLVKLQKLKNDESPDKLSADTKATIAAHLLGLGLILNFERAGALTSKAVGFLTRLR